MNRINIHMPETNENKDNGEFDSYSEKDPPMDPKHSKPKKVKTNKKNKPSDGLKVTNDIESLFEKLNQVELQKALDKWLKGKELDSNTTKRDLNCLSTNIAEYLESYMLFGYDLHGQRVLMYSLKSPKDTDAIIEFLKKLFIRQQSTDFLGDQSPDDRDPLQDEEDDMI